MATAEFCLYNGRSSPWLYTGSLSGPVQWASQAENELQTQHWLHTMEDSELGTSPLTAMVLTVGNRHWNHEWRKLY